MRIPDIPESVRLEHDAEYTWRVAYEAGYRQAIKDTRTEQLQFEVVRPPDDDPYIQALPFGEVPF